MRKKHRGSASWHLNETGFFKQCPKARKCIQERQIELTERPLHSEENKQNWDNL